ncbi:MAG TPA: integrase arm-type DNA-binding domain-containing protein [Allosphingosinicella sp.]|jgi:integrase|nr:integrase arm-type DNA-binding domain-containing protein [Allosphingosinicella sp.]
MPSEKLTKRTVDAAGTAAAPLYVWDKELSGFGLRVAPSGAKSFVFQYRMGGREAKARRFTIGRYGSPWTPEGARKEAERLLIMVRQGIDPANEKQERRRQATDLAFSGYVVSFAELYLKERWKRWELGRNILQRHVVPELREKPLPLIRRADLNPVWDRLRDRPAVARLTFATLRKLFRWAVNRGDIERSPLEGIEAPKAVSSRDRVLADAELRAVWEAAGAVGRPFDCLYRMLLLTGQRRDEVARMDWSELDRGSALWTLPAARSKNKQPNLVPLSDLARRCLDELAGGDLWPRSGLVFSTTARTPISGFSKAKRRLDQEVSNRLEPDAEFEPWRVHDLRRTLATGLQRLGVRFEVTEAVLNHVSGAKGGIAGVYQRHDWKDEKRAALEGWARHIERLLSSPPATSNVVLLKQQVA